MLLSSFLLADTEQPPTLVWQQLQVLLALCSFAPFSDPIALLVSAKTHHTHSLHNCNSAWRELFTAFYFLLLFFFTVYHSSLFLNQTAESEIWITGTSCWESTLSFQIEYFSLDSTCSLSICRAFRIDSSAAFRQQNCQRTKKIHETAFIFQRSSSGGGPPPLFWPLLSLFLSLWLEPD